MLNRLLKKYLPLTLSALLVFTGTMFWYTQTARAAIAINSQESGGTAHKSTTASNTNTLTWTFTNTAGTKLVCIAASSVYLDGSGLVLSTPTYNGVSMTLIGTQTFIDSNRSVVGIYYLDSPATGGNTVSIAASKTSGSSLKILGGCISFTGVATGIGTHTSGANTSGTTATAGAITTASGNYIVAGGSWGSGTGGTAGTGFTKTFLVNGSGDTAGDDILGEYKASTGGATTPTFKWTGSDNWIIVAVELIAASSPLSPTPT